MSEDEIKIEDMSLQGEPEKEGKLGDLEGEPKIKKGEKFDIDSMGLESPTPEELEARIGKLFPNEGVIHFEANVFIFKMKGSNYRLDQTPISELKTEDLNKLDDFLKVREKE